MVLDWKSVEMTSLPVSMCIDEFIDSKKEKRKNFNPIQIINYKIQGNRKK